jgi:asparagine synthase (glutamine-hydrolysing)
MEIKLTDNKAFQWRSKNGISAKGYLFDQSGRFYEGEQLPDFFADIKTPMAFKERLEDANGLFSVVIISDSGFYAAVDIVRSFPLYYSIHDKRVRLSDSPGEGGVRMINSERIPEFLACGHVTGDQTLLYGVYQIQPGAYICYEHSKPVKQEFYYRHSVELTNAINSSQAGKNLCHFLRKIGERLIVSLKGRQAVIPLSGGYDSRLLAVLLKENAYPNVLCYTFGRDRNFEVERAKSVAKKLDFPWYFIKNDHPLIDDYFNCEHFKAYYQYVSCYSSMFFMEQYFALRYLHDKKLIAEDAVFIPGFSGDFIAGSHLKNQFTEKSNKQCVVRAIYRNNYYLHPMSAQEKHEILFRISDFIRPGQGLAHSLYEDWDFKERQSKFIVNSARIYPFFGYSYRLPFWDKELVLFFRSLPLALKNNKELYDSTVKKYFFRKYNLDRQDSPPAARCKYYLQDLKNSMRGFLPAKFRQHYVMRNDSSGYEVITRPMVEEMHNADFNYRPPDRSYNSVITQWYLLKLLQEVK